jgi:phosphoribosylformimino-5-aminoimidazole carboxamide ribotide isomerase
MLVVGVIDLLAGRAVHAVAGMRDRYQPVRPIVGALDQPGDSHALGRFYIDRLAVDAIYVADLDAIQGGPLQIDLLASLCKLGAPAYVDAGVATVDAARRLLAAGAAKIIAGLETLSSFDALARICADASTDRVIFSLDLHHGQAITTMSQAAPETLASHAIDAGVGGLIVIDLARVGTGAGVDVDLIGRVRRVVPPHVTLMAGGGIRNWSDLERVAAMGCDGALVASALHDGRVSAHDVARARGLNAPSV